MTTKTEPIFRSMLLAILLAVGAASVWAVLMIWGAMTVRSWATGAQRYQYVQVRHDGTPIIYSHNGIGWDARDLDGADLGTLRRDSYSTGPLLAGPKQLRQPLGGIRWSRRLVSFAADALRETHWFFLHDGQTDGRGYFVGYEKRSKLPVGYIGRSGFQDDRPVPGDCFRMDARKMFCNTAIANSSFSYGVNSYAAGGYYPVGAAANSSMRWAMPEVVCLLTDEGIVTIDLRSRQVEEVYQSAELVSIGLATDHEDTDHEDTDEQGAGPPRGPFIKQHFLVARTPDRVLVFDYKGREFAAFSIPGELADSRFTCYPLTDSSILLHAMRDTGRGTHNNRFLWVDRQGKVVRREEVLLVGGTRLPSSLRAASVLPSPAILASVGLWGMVWEHLERREENTYSGAMARVFREYWPALVISCLMSLAAAYVCFRRQRRYALAGTWAWVAMVFLFGIPGLLGYLFCRRWPVLEACGACHAPAPRDRPSCSACDAPFPQPAPKGIEVFA